MNSANLDSNLSTRLAHTTQQNLTNRFQIRNQSVSAVYSVAADRRVQQLSS